MKSERSQIHPNLPAYLWSRSFEEYSRICDNCTTTGTHFSVEGRNSDNSFSFSELAKVTDVIVRVPIDIHIMGSPLTLACELGQTQKNWRDGIATGSIYIKTTFPE